MDILKLNIFRQQEIGDSTSNSTSNTKLDGNGNPIIANQIYRGPDGTTRTGQALLLSGQDTSSWIPEGAPTADKDVIGDDITDKDILTVEERNKNKAMLNVNLEGGKKGVDKKKRTGPTFADLRALNAMAANKIERVPQRMPASQITRVDPVSKSQAIEKQKQDAIANANAARVLGGKSADPTMNVLQNLGILQQTNQATQKTNLMQGENVSNQKARQREQTNIANQIEVQNQNIRTQIQNAAEREKAQKRAAQRATTAQIGNTWLGEKEREQAMKTAGTNALVDKYAQYTFGLDPENKKLQQDNLQAKQAHAAKSQEYKDALYQYRLDPNNEQKKALVEKLTSELEQLSSNMKATQEAYDQAFNDHNAKVLQYEREVGLEGFTAGFSADDRFMSWMKEQGFNLDGTSATKTQSKKNGGTIQLMFSKGGDLALKQQYKIELENLRNSNKIEQRSRDVFYKSLVLPEPKAYYLSVKLMADRNKQINDMFQDAYKALFNLKK